jgi:hypothetical protein
MNEFIPFKGRNRSKPGEGVMITPILADCPDCKVPLVEDDRGVEPTMRNWASVIYCPRCKREYEIKYRAAVTDDGKEQRPFFVVPVE